MENYVSRNLMDYGALVVGVSLMLAPLALKIHDSYKNRRLRGDQKGDQPIIEIITERNEDL